MQNDNTFFRSVCAIAIPAALQSMLQASFSVVDQIMIGQLGSTSVAAVGLAGKFSSVYSVLVSAIAAVAGILIAQQLGGQNGRAVGRSFRVNLGLAGGLALAFTALSLLLPGPVMGLYSQDVDTVAVAAGYLRILSGTYLPVAGAALLATLLRCMERAALPLYAGIAAALLNTGLNYVLIFGRLGAPALGAAGAGIATLVSQLANFILLLVLYYRYARPVRRESAPSAPLPPFDWRQYAAMLLPVLVCEFMWSLGENVYAAIYGRLGTASCAAMTLLNPIQSLMTGALCGLSQAAGVLVGKRLGSGDGDGAYRAGKRLTWYGLCGAAVLSCVILLLRPYYVRIYAVEPAVRALTGQIMVAYALVAPFKVLNMIMSGGVLRSGGKTGYVMCIDLIGTWCFGVPLGLLAAFVLRLSIPYVYFILSLEECVRFGISVAVFRKRRWMHSL